MSVVSSLCRVIVDASNALSTTGRVLDKSISLSENYVDRQLLSQQVLTKDLLRADILEARIDLAQRFKQLKNLSEELTFTDKDFTEIDKAIFEAIASKKK